MKLFEVCRLRGLPVVTVINKWDRPGHEALALMDEIETRTGMVPTPITWPVGVAGDFRGVLDRRNGTYAAFTRTVGGATRAPQQRMSSQAAAAREGVPWKGAAEEVELLSASGAVHDQELFLAGASTPVLFASAVLNFGVEQLLEVLLEAAPAPSHRVTVDGGTRGVDEPFSGQVFKVQSGMDSAHRDRVGFVRVASGRFERGMAVTNSRTGRSVTTKYAHRVFGSERTGVDDAWPGDVVALVNTGGLRVGDTLFAGRAVTYPPMPLFAPEHFASVRAKDLSRYKQFQRGITELHHEGVVQTLRSDLRGEQSPVLAAVGPMQFDVVVSRMAHEYNAPVDVELLPFSVARRTSFDWVQTLSRVPGVEVFSNLDGTLLALFPDKWRLAGVERDNEGIVLEPLAADTIG